jgi:hypothetical protein
MSETIQATVEIAEPEVKVVNEIPTREDVKARGWSKDEDRLSRKARHDREGEEGRRERASGGQGRREVGA